MIIELSNQSLNTYLEEGSGILIQTNNESEVRQLVNIAKRHNLLIVIDNTKEEL